MQAAQELVEVCQGRGNTRQPRLAFVSRFRRQYGLSQRNLEGLKSTFLFAAFRKPVQMLFGILDLLHRGIVDIGIVGAIDDVLPEIDQFPA